MKCYIILQKKLSEPEVVSFSDEKKMFDYLDKHNDDFITVREVSSNVNFAKCREDLTTF